MPLFFRLQDIKVYWILRSKLLKLKFEIKSFFYGQKERTAGEQISLWKALFELGSVSLFSSIAVLILLQILEFRCIAPFFSKFPNTPEFLIQIASARHSLLQNAEVLKDYFGVIASITGVFLGLYFTTISVVASSAFVTLPDSLRGLLLREKFGNFYIDILARLTALCLLAVFLILLGQKIGILVLLVITFFTCLGIFGFIKLGNRALYFFNASLFVDEIFADLFKYIKYASAKGFQYLDINFQAHYQNRAADSLKTLKTLVDVCLLQKHLRDKSLSIVLHKIVLFLTNYQDYRRQIPTQSRWYALKPKHKSWFLSDSGAIVVALESQTPLQPEQVPEYHWVEEKLMDILMDALERALKLRNYHIVYDVIVRYHEYLEKLGGDLELRLANEFLTRIESFVEKFIKQFTQEQLLEKDSQVVVGIFDAWLLCYLFHPLGFYKLIQNQNAEKVFKQIYDIDWESENGIYLSNFSPPMLSYLEYLRKALKFEKSVEGQRITQDWYIKQYLARTTIDLYKESVSEIVKILTFLRSKSEAFISEKSCLLANLTAQRGLETCSKIEAHFKNVKTVEEDIKKKISLFGDSKWAEINWDEIGKTLENENEKLFFVKAKCLPYLSTIKRSSEQPDMFGQSYEIVCQETARALVSKKENRFNNLFPSLTESAFYAYQYLMNEVKDKSPEVIIAVTSEPLIDILELSGYALIYSELYEMPEIWKVCQASWKSLLDKSPDKKAFINWVITIYQYRLNQWKIFPRDTIRTNWEMWLNHALETEGVASELSEFRARPRNYKSHKSALIRAISHVGFRIGVSTEEIFILFYLLKLPEAEGIKFGESDFYRRYENELKKDNTEEP